MAKKRMYKVDVGGDEKESWPSVTTIIDLYPKPKLVDAASRTVANYIANELAENWDVYTGNKGMAVELAASSANAHKRVWAESKQLGTAVHKMIEQYLMTGGDVTYPPNEAAIRAFQGFLKWEQEVDLKPIAVEEMVYGDRYAGRLDLVAKVNGKTTVIDVKVAKAVWPTMGFQLAAYTFAQPGPIPPKSGILLINPIDGLHEFIPMDKMYTRDIEVFFVLRDLWWKLYELEMLP